MFSYCWQKFLLCAVWFEPADVDHVWKLTESDTWNYLTYASPNFVELQRMVTFKDALMTPEQGLLSCISLHILS